MTNPAVIIVTGLVVAVAAVIAVFASNSERPQAYERRRTQSSYRNRPSSPPSSPIPASYTSKRRKSPPRRSSCRGSESSRDSSTNQRRECLQCGETPLVRIQPCNHPSLCRGCGPNYLETKNTCPECHRKIDSISPTIPPFGKCRGCQKFTKIINLLPCSDSLDLCINCFKEQGRSYKECPECKFRIRGCEPASKTIGICKVCDQFTQLALFLPCGHADFCMKHAEQYLSSNNLECHDCSRRVARVE